MLWIKLKRIFQNGKIGIDRYSNMSQILCSILEQIICQADIWN